MNYLIDKLRRDRNLHPAFRSGLVDTGRPCAICGKTTSPNGQKDTYGFRTILSRNGITGDKAHRECVAGLGE